MNLFRFAWRNLWRSRRRTLITVSSILFGVLFSTYIRGMQEGTFSGMIDNMVRFFTGYAQVQAVGYFDNHSINYTLESSPGLHETIAQCPGVTLFTPRLESFALASTGHVSQGTMVMGIDPSSEDRISGLSKRVSNGAYLDEKDRGIMLGETLAHNLDVNTGDTLILLGQGYHGISAAGLFPVRGLLSYPNPDISRQIIVMDYRLAQEFYGAEDRLTSVVIMVDHREEVEAVVNYLNEELDDESVCLSWEELQPGLVQFVEGKKAGGKVMGGILFMVIAFGILGTVIMMLAERNRELGMMVSLGMSKLRLLSIVCIEMLWIGLLGSLAGTMVSLPLLHYIAGNPIKVGGEMGKAFIDFGIEPVIHASTMPFVFTRPALTVFYIVLVISVFPMIKILRLKVITALRA